jgi:hypothetical protein
VEFITERLSSVSIAEAKSWGPHKDDRDVKTLDMMAHKRQTDGYQQSRRARAVIRQALKCEGDFVEM